MHEWLESFQWVQLISDGRSDYRRNQRVESETRVLEHSDLNLGKGRGKKKKAIKIYQVKEKSKTKIKFWREIKKMT